MDSRKPTFLLVSGFMLDADVWTEVRPDLEPLGRIVDADLSQDDSIEKMASRAVSNLNGPAIVIGFSMGGYVARQIVYQAPHLVRGLALIATSSRGEDPARGPGAQGAVEFRQISRAAVARALHPDHRTDAMIERVQAMSRRLGSEVFTRQSQLKRADDTSRLPEIRCPTLVVAAAQDELRTIEESETLKRNIAGASLTIIDQSGHLIPLERPRQLADVLFARFRQLDCG